MRLRRAALRQNGAARGRYFHGSACRPVPATTMETGLRTQDLERGAHPVLERAMASTAKTQALHRGLTSARHRVHMVVLQELPRLAALPRVADERALALIPLPYRALHVRRDVAWVQA